MILASEDGGRTFTSLTLPYTPVMTIPIACGCDCGVYMPAHSPQGAVQSVNIHPFKRIISILTATSQSLVYIHAIFLIINMHTSAKLDVSNHLGTVCYLRSGESELE